MIEPLKKFPECLPQMVIQHTIFSEQAKNIYKKNETYRFSILREPGSHFISLFNYIYYNINAFRRAGSPDKFLQSPTKFM